MTFIRSRAQLRRQTSKKSKGGKIERSLFPKKTPKTPPKTSKTSNQSEPSMVTRKMKKATYVSYKKKTRPLYCPRCGKRVPQLYGDCGCPYVYKYDDY